MNHLKSISNVVIFVQKKSKDGPQKFKWLIEQNKNKQVVINIFLKHKVIVKLHYINKKIIYQIITNLNLVVCRI